MRRLFRTGKLSRLWQSGTQDSSRSFSVFLSEKKSTVDSAELYVVGFSMITLRADRSELERSPHWSLINEYLGQTDSLFSGARWLDR
jgi:hypothetical protein